MSFSINNQEFPILKNSTQRPARESEQLSELKWTQMFQEMITPEEMRELKPFNPLVDLTEFLLIQRAALTKLGNKIKPQIESLTPQKEKLIIELNELVELCEKMRLKK